MNLGAIVVGFACLNVGFLFGCWLTKRLLRRQGIPPPLFQDLYTEPSSEYKYKFVFPEDAPDGLDRDGKPYRDKEEKA